MSGKADLEFASEAWVRHADEALKALVAKGGVALAGQALSVCQVLTGAPAHLRPASGGELAWSLVIQDGTGTARPIELDQATLKTRGDYEIMRRSARAVDDGSSGSVIERARIRQQAITERRIVPIGSLEGQSAELMDVLGALHNRMAQRTA